MTAATPMMMPSMVRTLRSLFTRSARRAMRALARAYRGWWDGVKQLPPEQARETDPLDGTSFRWH